MCSVVQRVENALAATSRLDPKLYAWVLVDADGARRDAARLTAEADAGKSRGPLHGIPLGIKDIIDVRGMPTRAGSSLLLGKPAERDAPVVAGDIWSLTSAFSIDTERAHVFGAAYRDEGPLDAADLCALPDLMRCRWLYCRVDAAQRKVEPHRRAEFVTRDLGVPLACIDALEPSILDGTLFAS